MIRLFTADARTTSAQQFLEGFFGPYEEKRQAHIERTIRKIESGADLYGVPPMLVEHCREIMAQREAEAQRDAA